MRSFLIVVGCLLLMSGGESVEVDTVIAKNVLLQGDNGYKMLINSTSITWFKGTDIQYMLSYQAGELVIAAPPDQFFERWQK